MKQFIIILALMFAFAISNAQIDTTKVTETEYVTNTDAEKLIDKYSTKIEASIMSLAETLKTPAEHVYSIMVKQQYVKASTGIILFIIIIVLVFTSIKQLNHKDAWEDYDPKLRGVIGIILGIMAIMLIIVFFTAGYLSDITQGFVNPEYGAIKDIISMIK